MEVPTVNIIHPKKQALLNQVGGKSLHSDTNTDAAAVTILSPNRLMGHKHHTSPQGRSTSHPRSTDQEWQQRFRELHVLFPVIFSFHLSSHSDCSNRCKQPLYRYCPTPGSFI